MIEPRSSFVVADAVRLHYLEWEHVYIQNATTATQEASTAEHYNSDSIPIVMLHGLGATADTWRLVAERLCQHHPVLAFDLRGHGQSDQPATGYNLATIAEDVICGMATLGLGQVVMVGHGWGARVALVLAARHPALVSHLVLVDCPHVEPRHWPGMTRERFIREGEAQQEIYSSRAQYLQALQQEMAGFWSPEVEAIVLSQIRETSDGRVEEILRPEYQHQIRAAVWDDRALNYYSKLTSPVLLVPAAAQPDDEGEPPERLEEAEEFAAAKGYMAAQVARAIHRCSVCWMPNTAHDIQLQRPQALVEAITTFLQE